VILLPMDSYSFGTATGRNVQRKKTRLKDKQKRSANSALLKKRAEDDYKRYSQNARLVQYRQMLKSQQAGLQQRDRQLHASVNTETGGAFRSPVK
ncbi:MAG: hypothetical protein ABSA86_10560, partial [Oryzomonas sp.]